jgi:hypothetical protein
MYLGSIPPTGTQVYLRLIQDATGGRTFAFPPNLLVDPSFAIDLGANKVTVLPIQFTGASWEFFAAPESFPMVATGWLAGTSLFNRSCGIIMQARKSRDITRR